MVIFATQKKTPNDPLVFISPPLRFASGDAYYTFNSFTQGAIYQHLRCPSITLEALRSNVPHDPPGASRG